jgi:NlpC/P60 family putative phage cell wall peptidase
MCILPGETLLQRQIVASARRWIGTPYRHQASTCGAGADCLGLIRGVWREVIGPEPTPIPPYTRDWAEPSKEEVLMIAAPHYLQQRETDSLQIGDVVLFRMKQTAVAKHLGIISQIGQSASFIHAYSGHCVMENSLSWPWIKRIAAVYQFPSGVS